MVFKPFTHFARQKFIKSFTHGYAQTVVAATQSSFAASTGTLSPFGHATVGLVGGKPGTVQIHNAFQSGSGTSGAGAKAGSSTSGNQGNGDLAAYYAAWQQQHHNGDGDNDWKQFQFARRIGWKGPSTLHDAVDKGKATVTQQGEDVHHLDVPSSARGKLVRANSTSAVDEIRREEDDSNHLEELTASFDTTVETAPEKAASTSQADAESSQDIRGDEAQIAKESTSTDAREKSVPPPAESTVLNPSTTTESQAQTFLDQIRRLNRDDRHEEIPAVFEAMLVADVKPSTDAYNALLAAAVRITAPPHQVVHKALSVYTDMLRRRVTPDVQTYVTLIDLVASRALDVSKKRTALEERRTRFAGAAGAGRSMLASSDAERDILAEDDSCSVALRLFDASKADSELLAFPLATYELLTQLCAEHGKPTEMIDIYAHMETQRVMPSPDVFISMIIGFARSRDLVSAVECYNEYKALVTAADEEIIGIMDRRDDTVYAALVRAYVMSDKSEGALRFLDKVRNSYDYGPADQMEARLQNLEDIVVPQGFVDQLLAMGCFQDALNWTESARLSPSVRNGVWAQVCKSAADHNEAEIAVRAFQHLAPSSPPQSEAAVALLALHLRSDDIASASLYWDILTANGTKWTLSIVEPGTMYVAGLLNRGQDAAALQLARQIYHRVRSAPAESNSAVSAIEEIDESMEHLGRHMRERGIVPSAGATMDLMWSMIENGGLVTPVAVQLLAGLGPESIARLSFEDVILLIQVQGGMITKGGALVDPSSSARFTHLVDIILARGMFVDQRTQDLVEQTLRAMESSQPSLGRPDLLSRWHGHLQQPTWSSSTQPSYSPQTVSPMSPAVEYESSVDPYGASTDHRGSSIIADELERKADRFGGSRLKKALATLRNIRRAGRHPRYVTYAKLISAAAKENRADVTRDVLTMARTDVPYIPQSPAVRQGWTSILDAMVAACLSLSDRAAAAQHHQELSAMGAAPSANTFGLYITTLKESTKTFDEATEAVKIFHRAKREGVEPSSFLYNALIGKLGKARRIDDCLYFFAEMRNLGIRPTSVTYGTVVNALCRVSDERFAEELFEEMESMPNYKPRPAPYNTLMQFFLTTKRDRSKVLAYYERMMSKGIPPASHTFKLLIDTYATLEPVDMVSAEAVLDKMHQARLKPEAVHYASLIHAKGCILHDMEGTQKTFDDVLADPSLSAQACIYQAYLEAMVANHRVAETPAVLDGMRRRGVGMTPYIANSLIHGWTLEGNIDKAKAIFDTVSLTKREPSTYEAMTRAFVAADDQVNAMQVVRELSTRGYPSAVVDKIYDLAGPRASSKQTRSSPSSGGST